MTRQTERYDEDRVPGRCQELLATYCQFLIHDCVEAFREKRRFFNLYAM